MIVIYSSYCILIHENGIVLEVVRPEDDSFSRTTVTHEIKRLRDYHRKLLFGKIVESFLFE